MNKKLGTAIILLAIIIGGYTVWHSFYLPSDSAGIPVTGDSATADVTVAAATTTSGNKADETPVRIQIPKLHIDAKVIPVGITSKGLMDAPHNFTDTGWYKNGTIPGRTGSAVIDGHEDNAIDLDGVFKHLDELKEGDDVYIVRKDGKKLHFKVQESEVYAYNDTAHLDKVFNRSTSAWLNLITCSGKWVQAIKTNDKRIVVFTKLVD
jgi:LPXTG-site transpeptidase (sortase) family protein